MALNLLNSFPRLMVLGFSLIFIEPTLLMLWEGTQEYSEFLTTLIFVFWFYWDNKCGIAEYRDNF